jgi:hypothetical protein
LANDVQDVSTMDSAMANLFLLLAPLAIAVTTLLAAGCGPDRESCGPNSSCLASRLLVDACARDAKVTNGFLLGGIAECQGDFGVLNDTVQSSIFLANDSNLPVEIDVSVKSPVGTPVAAFFLDVAPPTVVVPGTRTEIPLTVIPIAPGAAVATLEIVTDADNVLAEGDDTISVDLLASVPKPATEP